MACSERWLFRMWHLRLLLGLLLFVGQNASAEEKSSLKDGTNNETAPQNNAESPHALIPTKVDGEAMSNGSNIFPTPSKEQADGVTNAAKPTKEIVISQTPAKPLTSNSSMNEAVKSISNTVTNQSTTQISNPKLQTTINEEKLEKSTTKEEKQEPITKVEEKPAPPSKDVEKPTSSLQAEQKPALPAKTIPTKPDSGKEQQPDPVANHPKSENTKKVPQVPPLIEPKDDTQVPGGEEDNEDIPSTLPSEGEETNYEGNGDIDAADEDDDTFVNPQVDAKKKDPPKDESTKLTYHPKNTIGAMDFDDGDSHFFVYFLTVVGMCIVMYVLFHNKQKILALIVEGRQERRSRRPNTSQYRPLDNNLEEVIQAGTPKNGRLATNIIY